MARLSHYLCPPVFLVLVNLFIVANQKNVNINDLQDPLSLTLASRSNVGVIDFSRNNIIKTTNKSNNNTTSHNGDRRPCRITVENKADYHYEVIESTIMKFPLPWDSMNCSKIHATFDVALAQEHQWANKNELDSWRQYFVNHLTGTTRERTIGDGAIVLFGTPQDYRKYRHEYDAYIGVSCDTFETYPQWMRKSPHSYCVLHGPATNLPKDLEERVSWVNPMYPRFFIPSDLPIFPPAQLHPDEPIRLCVKGTTYFCDKSLQLLVDTILTLSNPEMFAIQIMGGRSTKIRPVFSEISHLVTRIVEPDFYKFEEIMSRCHVLLPLIHPWDEGEKYFPSSDLKKLSGFISQAIGLKLPLLVHEGIYDVYKEHFTRKVWTYSSKHRWDSSDFRRAFGAMIDEISGVVVDR
ncbi:hypothetical protein ACHAXS_000658 [Conticribra weissflogii]